jgi:hypothetical protein
VPSEARIRGGADPGGRSAGSGIAHAWGALDRDRRLAAIAAVALFATMFLPWYQQNAVVSARRAAPLVSRNLNAFAVFTFIEAAVLLVAAAVLFLLYARAEGHNFQLPGGDGAVVLAAGLWAGLLLVLRLFDHPAVTQHGVAANVGVQWGIFFALAAAGLLAYAGSRMRAAQRPEPPLVRRSEAPRRPMPPGRSGEPPEPEWGHPPFARSPATGGADEETVVISRREETPRAAPVPASERTPSSGGRPPTPAGRRGRYPPAPRRAGAPSEQLSFEDPDVPLR